ncbi:DUF4345 domain-containing protein [Parasphingopyxis marina]|uniref:DUF4345 domain-containing protein n=1 Tax=Parasphingopyxis marina TaxID=2761622 RepID=A0A842HRP4_9SPHN|nr:DUF4345 domain-containing protein [Parasphingopyxis marina]MBC2776478.1 DUF4345 domain-containing protein [Parasphingopyxis marina]
MTRDGEKRVLQTAIAFACLVPILMGAASVIAGPAILSGVDNPPARDLDSHFRYLSGIFLVMGLAFASCIPGVERKTALFRLLGAMVVAGGLARALSAAQYGWPGAGHRFGLAMELGVVPLLMLWQARIARRFRGA